MSYPIKSSENPMKSQEKHMKSSENPMGNSHLLGSPMLHDVVEELSTRSVPRVDMCGRRFSHKK